MVSRLTMSTTYDSLVVEIPNRMVRSPQSALNEDEPLRDSKLNLIICLKFYSNNSE